MRRMLFRYNAVASQNGDRGHEFSQQAIGECLSRSPREEFYHFVAPEGHNYILRKEHRMESLYSLLGDG